MFPELRLGPVAKLHWEQCRINPGVGLRTCPRRDRLLKQVSAPRTHLLTELFQVGVSDVDGGSSPRGRRLEFGFRAAERVHSMAQLCPLRIRNRAAEVRVKLPGIVPSTKGAA